MEQVRYDFARHFYEKSWKKATPVLETKGQNENKQKKKKVNMPCLLAMNCNVLSFC
jgi:hypothetical protein